MPTVAEDNTNTLRQSLRWLRITKRTDGKIEDWQQEYTKLRIQDCLKARNRYRSDELMTVYIVDDGGDMPITYDEWDAVERHLYDLEDSLDIDELGASITLAKMTGRDYGQLEVWDE